MTIITNDKEERVMVPDSGLDRARLVWPATIKSVKASLKSDCVQKTIDKIKKYKMSALEKGQILFIASDFRLTRKF